MKDLKLIQDNLRNFIIAFLTQSQKQFLHILIQIKNSYLEHERKMSI